MMYPTNLWSLPAGKFEDGKKPIETAILKTHAEVGLKFEENELIPLEIYKYKSGQLEIEFYNFHTRLEMEKPVINLNKDGLDEYVWEKPAELIKRKNLIPNLKNYLKNRLGKNPL
jgi:8-oxo-dGTP pyrophosphatase MutT (NUDIX family)